MLDSMRSLTSARQVPKLRSCSRNLDGHRNWTTALVSPFATKIACLVLGSVLTAFTVGNAMLAVAAWLAPTFMLRFVRTSRLAPGIYLGTFGLICAHAVAWDGVLPFQGAFYYAVVAGVGLTLFLPFIVDRLFCEHASGLVRAFIFPAALTAVEYLFSQLGNGSWGAVAYSQYGNLALNQIVSVTGLWGISFLTGWFASVFNDLWECRGSGAQARRRAAAFGAALALVLVGGGLRLTLAPAQTPSVRIAGIVVDNMDVFRNSWGPLSYGQTLSEQAADQVRPKADALLKRLIAQSRAEARAGAKIVVWSEGNALAFKKDERELIAAGQRLAAEEKIYLFMSVATMQPGHPRAENKIIVVDPQGRVRATYLKSHPTPGEMSIPGDGVMGFLDTPYGTLAWAICYDYDYPALIRQAAVAGADILIDPSWEGPAMAPLHSQMASFRAIENGASLFRPANGGMSLAVDARGQVLAALSGSAAEGPHHTLVASLPIEGTWTIYGHAGDTLPWMAAGFLLFAFITVSRKASPTLI